MEWTMIYLFFALKVPLVAACLLVWWAIRAEPEPAADEPQDDGGARHRPAPPGRPPRAPRRGPHGDPAPLPPRRVRSLDARGRAPARRS